MVLHPEPLDIDLEVAPHVLTLRERAFISAAIAKHRAERGIAQRPSGCIAPAQPGHVPGPAGA